MVKELWINLPVKDVKKSIDFFTQIGFPINPGPGNTDTSASLAIGSKKIIVMLFEEAAFKGFTNAPIANTQEGTEVLLSFDAESKEEVDEIAQKVLAAGGKTNHQPYTMDGFMYGCVFSDLDGHRWNILHMDMSKMRK